MSFEKWKEEFLKQVQRVNWMAFWSPKPGKNLVKIVVKGNLPAVNLQEHFLKWSCACFGPGCVVCDIVRRFGLSEATKRDMYYSYVVDLLSNETPRIKLWGYGITVAQQLATIVDQLDIFTPETGAAIQVVRHGSGRNTRYQILPDKPINIFEIPGVQEEYESLAPLEEFAEQRIQDSKASLVDNILQMDLAPDILNSILLLLKDRGFEISDDLLVATPQEAVEQVKLQQQEFEQAASQPEQAPTVGTTPGQTFQTTTTVADLIKKLKTSGQ